MSNHREELKDEYHYPNSVVYGLNDKIESKNKEIKILREALEFIKSTTDEEKINLGMMRQVEYCAHQALAEIDKMKGV